VVARIALMTLAVLATSAHAESPVVGGHTPRSIGRAGVGTASDDGGSALLVNPAAIARREAARMQLAVAFLDDEMSWLHSASAPVNRDQSSSRLLPMIAIEGAIGDWILGAGVTTNARTERLLRRPGVNAPAGDYGKSFEYRYDGFAGSFRRDTLMAGASHRIGDTVAAGLSLSASRVELSELRRVWAGDTNRKIGSSMTTELLGDPTQDVELGMTASAYTPGVVAGVLVAPESTSLEIAASASWMGPARASGAVTGAGAIPQSQYAVSLDSNAARIEIEQPLTFRTGVRWLSERWIAEVGGDLWVVPKRARAPVWRFDGLHITDATTIGSPREVDVTGLPSRMSTRTHGALRAAIDVELIAGFLWATAGYAYATSGTASTRLSPTFGDLGGHTAAVGLEATAGGFTVTLGAARTWSIKQPEPTSAWKLDNPFGTGDAMVPEGTFDGSVDMLGLSIDAELWAPE
jgi:hypothetical protein